MDRRSMLAGSTAALTVVGLPSITKAALPTRVLPWSQSRKFDLPNGFIGHQNFAPDVVVNVKGPMEIWTRSCAFVYLNRPGSIEVAMLDVAYEQDAKRWLLDNMLVPEIFIQDEKWLWIQVAIPAERAVPLPEWMNHSASVAIFEWRSLQELADKLGVWVLDNKNMNDKNGNHWRVATSEQSDMCGRMNVKQVIESWDTGRKKEWAADIHGMFMCMAWMRQETKAAGHLLMAHAAPPPKKQKRRVIFRWPTRLRRPKDKSGGSFSDDPRGSAAQKTKAAGHFLMTRRKFAGVVGGEGGGSPSVGGFTRRATRGAARRNSCG